MSSQDNTVRETELADFATARAAGALTVDVREPDEYVGGHVPGARNIPLDQLGRHTDDLVREAAGAPVFVVCASGNRSKAGAGLLGQAGADARSVAGGTGGWMKAGNPVVAGSEPA